MNKNENENLKCELQTLASYHPADLDNPEFEVAYESSGVEEGFATVCCIDLATRSLKRIEELEKILSMEQIMKNEPTKQESKDEINGQVDRIVMPSGSPLGLCDSNGTEFRVGSVVRRCTEINSEVHGNWVDYVITLQGTTPLLSYLKSEKGQVLPVGYTGCCLCNEYDSKMFVFATDSKSLRPDCELVIQEA